MNIQKDMNLTEGDQSKSVGGLCCRRQLQDHGGNDDDYSRQNRNINCCTVFWVSTFLNVVLLCVLIGLHLFYNLHNHLESDGDDTGGSSSVCILCDSGDDFFVDYRFTDTQGRQMCCYNQSGIQDLIYTVFAGEILHEDKNDGNGLPSRQKLKVPDWWSNRSSAAHLVLNTSQVIRFKLPWTQSEEDKISFLSSDFNIKDGRIQVPSWGLYFVYSVITIENCGEKIKPEVNHRIERQHQRLPKSGPELLFLRTYGNYRNEQKTFTSFICGSKFLRKGDEISCAISDPRLIHKAPHGNFFGVFKL